MQLESSVTLFDDDKVETRFAELQITADGITSEVSKKVGNDEVISRINQSAEGIQIQANKVNIEGATIFSSGRLSQSSLNSAYDAKGAAASSVNNLKSDLSSSSGTTVINGGHIVTGTLSAGAINANSGTFSVLNVPDLNASKITAGTLDANRIGAASIAIGKLDSNAQATISNAAKTATNFITDIDSSGIWVTPSGLKPSDTSTGAGATGTRINGSGMQIYKGGVEVASYSDTTIELGKNSISSVIHLCGNKGSIERHNTLGMLISTNESDKGVTLRTPSYSRLTVNPNNVEMYLNSTTSFELTADRGDSHSMASFEVDYLQLVGHPGVASTFWLYNTVPPAGSQTYNAVWHGTEAGNYGLYRPASSSRRYKEDIKPVEDDRLDPHRLYDISVMQFKFKEGYFLPDDPYEQNRVDVVGLIAEDVLEHYPQAAIMIGEEVENWDERYIIPPMLKLIQEQNDRITELEKIYRREVTE